MQLAKDLTERFMMMRQKSTLVIIALMFWILATPPHLCAEDPLPLTGDWTQWGGDSGRNNTP